MTFYDYNSSKNECEIMPMLEIQYLTTEEGLVNSNTSVQRVTGGWRETERGARREPVSSGRKEWRGEQRGRGEDILSFVQVLHKVKSLDQQCFYLNIF